MKVKVQEISPFHAIEICMHKTSCPHVDFYSCSM